MADFFHCLNGSTPAFFWWFGSYDYGLVESMLENITAVSLLAMFCCKFSSRACMTELISHLTAHLFVIRKRRLQSLFRELMTTFGNKFNQTMLLGIVDGRMPVKYRKLDFIRPFSALWLTAIGGLFAALVLVGELPSVSTGIGCCIRCQHCRQPKPNVSNGCQILPRHACACGLIFHGLLWRLCISFALPSQ